MEPVPCRPECAQGGEGLSGVVAVDVELPVPEGAEQALAAERGGAVLAILGVLDGPVGGAGSEALGIEADVEADTEGGAVGGVGLRQQLEVVVLVDHSLLLP